MNRKLTVLISGASVAGPALAFWLHRHGFAPTVVERAPGIRPGGQAVDIRGAAIDVVERMGLMEQVRRGNTNMTGMSYVDERGRRVASLDAAFGVLSDRDVEIERGDLTQILYQATRRDVEYLFGDSITELSQGEDGVKVSFQHAQPRVFDLVVGADGLHSNVRRLAFGPEADYVRDLGLFLSIFTVPNHLNLDRDQLIYPTPGAVTTLSSSKPDHARAMFFFNAPGAKWDYRDVAGQQRILAQRYAQVGWEVPRLMEMMRAADDFYFDTTSQVVMDSWHRGRITLVGDAGYSASPLSGQGTGLALVGAYVLAEELARAAGDHRIAFASYQDRMREFVAVNQKIAAGNASRMAPTSEFQIKFMNFSIRSMRYLPFKKQMMALMTKDVAKASTAITI